ncbi:MAG: putative nucleic acid-binding protein [Bacteroidia bacterium]|jgi:predicted nucleic acid-binding protein
MNRILVDSDVILDALFERKEFVDQSKKILDLCEKKKIHVFLTPVILANLYYLLRKTATHQKVVDHLQHLLIFFDILQISKKVILTALESEFKDFEDAL